MKKCNSNLLFLAIGAAVGAAVGYVIGTDKEKKDQWIDEVNNLVDRIRHNVKSSATKGERVLDEIINDEE